MSNITIDNVFLVLIKDLIAPKYINLQYKLHVFVRVVRQYDRKNLLLTPFMLTWPHRQGARTHCEYKFRHSGQNLETSMDCENRNSWRAYILITRQTLFVFLFKPSHTLWSNMYLLHTLLLKIFYHLEGILAIVQKVYLFYDLDF